MEEHHNANYTLISLIVLYLNKDKNMLLLTNNKFYSIIYG
jgi:hypothetical protein